MQYNERERERRVREFYCKVLNCVIMEAEKSKVRSGRWRTRTVDVESSSPSVSPKAAENQCPSSKTPRQREREFSLTH